MFFVRLTAAIIAYLILLIPFILIILGTYKYIKRLARKKKKFEEQLTEVQKSQIYYEEKR